MKATSRGMVGKKYGEKSGGSRLHSLARERECAREASGTQAGLQPIGKEEGVKKRNGGKTGGGESGAKEIKHGRPKEKHVVHARWPFQWRVHCKWTGRSLDKLLYSNA